MSCSHVAALKPLSRLWINMLAVQPHIPCNCALTFSSLTTLSATRGLFRALLPVFSLSQIHVGLVTLVSHKKPRPIRVERVRQQRQRNDRGRGRDDYPTTPHILPPNSPRWTTFTTSNWRGSASLMQNGCTATQPKRDGGNEGASWQRVPNESCIRAPSRSVMHHKDPIYERYYYRMGQRGL